MWLAYNPKMKAAFIFALCPLCRSSSVPLGLYSQTSPLSREFAVQTLGSIERRDPALDSVETFFTVLVLCLALLIGFRLAIRPAPRRIYVPSTPSTATQSPEQRSESKSFVFEDLDLKPKVLFPEDFEPRASFETGRLESSFSDVKELWARGEERLLQGRHRLDGKDYLLRELTLRLKGLQDLGKAQQFQTLRRRLLLESPLFLSYVTSWVEEAPHSEVKLYAQIELFSGRSLVDLEASGRRLSTKEAAFIRRQVVKAAAYADQHQLGGFDFDPAHIYVDALLHVKVGDFGTCARKQWSQTLSALLARLTQQPLVRQHSAPTVNTFSS